MKRGLDTQEIITEIDSDSEEDAALPSNNTGPRLVLVGSPRPSTSLVENHLESHPDVSTELNEESSSVGKLSSPDEVIDISDEDETPKPPPAKMSKSDARGRGRSLDPVWKEFTTNENGKVQCTECKKLVSDKVERLREHLKKCPARKNNSKNVAGQRKETRTSKSVEQPMPKPCKLATTTNKPIQPKIRGHLDIMRQTEKVKLDKEVAEYIYGTNLPFSHVENPRFVRFVKKLKPSYNPPSRRSIGGKLLVDCYETTMKSHREDLQGKNVTLMQDGWSTRTREAVLAHSLTTGEKSFFINAVPSAEEEKTAEYCANVLLATIDDVTLNLGVNVVAVVTDNCNAMTRMRDIVTITHPNIFTYGCQSHLLNLLGKKLTPKSLQHKIEKVQIFFRNHQKAAAALKARNGTIPVLPGATRWNSWIECFESYLKNQSKYLEISRQDELRLDFSSVTAILNDPGLYGVVRRTVEYLKPIQLALDEVQKETSCLADSIFHWLDLQQKFEFTSTEIQEYFNSLFKSAVTGVGLAALVLHPKYRGEGVSGELLNLAHAFLEKESPFAVIVAAQLRQKSDQYFPAVMFKDEVLKSCSSSTWWSSQFPYGKVQPAIIELAIKLMSLPASSADIERHFSTLGSIITERRNALGIEKAGKLCTIYKHLAGPVPPTGDGEDWQSENEEG